MNDFGQSACIALPRGCNRETMLPVPPLCPNCVQPMRLTRRIAADASHRGQEVYECTTCRVAMTQSDQPERQPTPAR